MAHSFVSYKNSNIRVNDFDLIFFIYLFVRVAKRTGYDGGMKEMFFSWTESVECGGAGNIDLQLDNFLCENKMYKNFICVFENLKDEISKLPDEVDVDFLGDLIKIKGVKFGIYKKKFLDSLILYFDNIFSAWVRD